jgi:hypothetical protein
LWNTSGRPTSARTLLPPAEAEWGDRANRAHARLPRPQVQPGTCSAPAPLFVTAFGGSATYGLFSLAERRPNAISFVEVHHLSQALLNVWLLLDVGCALTSKQAPTSLVDLVEVLGPQARDAFHAITYLIEDATRSLAAEVGIRRDLEDDNTDIDSLARTEEQAARCSRSGERSAHPRGRCPTPRGNF